MNNDEMPAACGLDCGTCRLRLAPTDPDAARFVIDWFRKQGWLAADEGMQQVLERKMYCKGCRGDRSIHWSADCRILTCCVDDHGHENCSRCDEFPCDRLIEFAAKNERYAAALDRLRDLRARQQ